ALACCALIVLILVVYGIKVASNSSNREEQARASEAQRLEDSKRAETTAVVDRMAARLAKKSANANAAAPTQSSSGTKPPNQNATNPDAGLLTPWGENKSQTPQEAASAVPFCLPARFVDQLSWDNPGPPESEMASFRRMLVDYMRSHGKEKIQFIVQED